MRNLKKRQPDLASTSDIFRPSAYTLGLPFYTLVVGPGVFLSNKDPSFIPWNLETKTSTHYLCKHWI